MAMTFSQVVEAVASSAQTQQQRTGGPEYYPTAMLVRHARVVLAADGTPDAPKSLVEPVVEAVRDLLAAELSGHGG